MLIDDIRANRMTAMKKRDAITKTLLTTLLGELEGDAKRTGTEITDDMVVRTCKKFVAGNDEVIKVSIGTCPSLVAENVILTHYIPAQLTEDELRAIIVSMNATNLGQVMQGLKAAHDGEYDGKLASTVAREVLG